jgi:hypothetical protein
VSAHAFWRSEEEEVRRRSEWKEGRKEGRRIQDIKSRTFTRGEDSWE